MKGVLIQSSGLSTTKVESLSRPKGMVSGMKIGASPYFIRLQTLEKIKMYTGTHFFAYIIPLPQSSYFNSFFLNF